MCLEMYLEILPTTATGKVFNDETVLCTDWRSILISTRAAPAAVTTTFKKKNHMKKLEITIIGKT